MGTRTSRHHCPRHSRRDSGCHFLPAGPMSPHHHCLELLLPHLARRAVPFRTTQSPYKAGNRHPGVRRELCPSRVSTPRTRACFLDGSGTVRAERQSTQLCAGGRDSSVLWTVGRETSGGLMLLGSDAFKRKTLNIRSVLTPVEPRESVDITESGSFWSHREKEGGAWLIGRVRLDGATVSVVYGRWRHERWDGVRRRPEGQFHSTFERREGQASWRDLLWGQGPPSISGLGNMCRAQ